jgi:hypothetical protein
MADELETRRFEHEARLSWFRAWSPLVMTIVTGVSAYLAVDLHAQRMEVQRLRLEQARFEHESGMEARKFERDTNLGFITQFLEQDDEVKRLALIDFVHQTAPDEGLQNWAEAQKQAVGKEVQSLRAALETARSAEAAAVTAQREMEARQTEAIAAQVAAEAEQARLEQASAAERAQMHKALASAKASAAKKSKAAKTAKRRADEALVAALAAKDQADDTEDRVRGRTAPSNLRATVLPPPPLGSGGVGVSALSPRPKVTVDQTYVCRCLGRPRPIKIAAPTRAEAQKVCAQSRGLRCRLAD